MATSKLDRACPPRPMGEAAPVVRPSAITWGRGDAQLPTTPPPPTILLDLSVRPVTFTFSLLRQSMRERERERPRKKKTRPLPVPLSCSLQTGQWQGAMPWRGKLIQCSRGTADLSNLPSSIEIGKQAAIPNNQLVLCPPDGRGGRGCVGGQGPASLRPYPSASLHSDSKISKRIVDRQGRMAFGSLFCCGRSSDGYVT